MTAKLMHHSTSGGKRRQPPRESIDDAKAWVLGRISIVMCRASVARDWQHCCGVRRSRSRKIA